jgi:hypothetical protein
MYWTGRIAARIIVATAFMAALSPPAAFASLSIAVGPSTNVTCASQVCTATAADANLSMKTLRNLLASGDVKVVSGSVAGDIVVAGALTWISSSTLTLDSYHSIIVNKPVSVAGTGGLVLTTNDGGTNGSLLFEGNGKVGFLSTTNQLVLNGDKYKLESDIKTLAYDIARHPSGYFALANSYDASVDGVYSAPPISLPFKGTFNGLGNVISKLTIVDQADADVGFFATLSAKGAVSSVGIANTVVEGGSAQNDQQTIGGLVGFSSGTISNSFVSGKVNGFFSGGLAGENQGAISLCQSSAIVHGYIVGGLVGLNEGIVDRSFATGAVIALYEYGATGGLVGFNANATLGTVSNSYATGGVKGGKFTSVGGLGGFSPQGASISTSYSTGAVNGHTLSRVGGFTGQSAGTTANTYWDTTTSGITDLSRGAGNVSNAPGITGLSTTQLQSGLPAGFDPTIWGENPSINGGLPYLFDNPPG